MNRKEYRTDKEAPSDMFIRSFHTGYGNDKIQCTWCGRLHLCPESDYWHNYCDSSEKWKAYCEEQHNKNPEGIILHHNCDAISSKEINGYNLVVGCPCNGLYTYEKFIWEHRNIIRNYLTLKIQQEYEWAQQELTKNKLAGFDDKTKEPFF